MYAPVNKWSKPQCKFLFAMSYRHKLNNSDRWETTALLNTLSRQGNLKDFTLQDHRGRSGIVT